MGTVSNPATFSSIKAAWGSASNNFSQYYRGGPIVNAGDATTINAAAAGLAMSQFNGVAATHTTSFTTTFVSTFNTSVAETRSTTTSFDTTFAVCMEEGTPILLPNGKSIPVEKLKVGMSVASVDLPGLKPETTANEYRGYQITSLDDTHPSRTEVSSISVDTSELMMEIWIDGEEKPLRVTPSHPLFIADSRNEVFRFLEASQLDLTCHRLLNRHGELVTIKDIQVFEGEFTIYKVDCYPLDVFFHQNVLGHNTKVGGNHNTTVVTSMATTTSWTTSIATSVVTSNVTTLVTSG
jgi:hypothetical protein